MSGAGAARRWPLALLLVVASTSLGQSLTAVELPLELTAGIDPPVDGLMQAQLQATPRLEIGVDSGAALIVSARLRLDADEALEPGRPYRGNYAAGSEPLAVGDTGTLELRDVYWERPLDNGLLRLGKQQIVWGRLDGIKLLDVLNPQNFREFILDDFDNSRISLWSAFLDLSVAGWRVELAAIPDYSAHEIPRPGAWFELRAPRFRFGAAPEVPALPSVTEGGRSALGDGALGLRVSRPIERFDVGLVAYTGSDHEPLGRLRFDAGEAVIERYYRRRELYGASLETALGAVALRAEAGYQPSRWFNTRGPAGLDSASADQLSVAVAADVDAPFGMLLNLQFLWDEVLDAPADLLRPSRDRLATVFLRRGFLYDTLRLEGRWYHSLDDGDDLYGLSLHYDSGDNTTLSVRFQGFSGRSEGLFGQFDGRERLQFAIQHTF